MIFAVVFYGIALLWLATVIPAAVLTCVRGQWLYFWFGYRVKADWKGCWRGVPVGPPGEGSRRRLSGCVSLFDFVF